MTEIIYEDMPQVGASGIYEDVLYVGGEGGINFTTMISSPGTYLKRLDVWAGNDTNKRKKIRCIRVTFVDGSSAEFGKKEKGKLYSFELHDGERITYLSMRGNGHGERTGYIRLQTNQDREFDTGSSTGKEDFTAEVGSGICAGITGWADKDINKLGFVFIKPLKSCSLKNVSYPTLEFDTIGIQPETIDCLEDKNLTSAPTPWHFYGGRDFTRSSEWSMSTGHELYGEIGVTAGVPEVAEVQAKFGWKVSETSTHSKREEISQHLSWDTEGILQPGKKIQVCAVTRVGKLPQLPYKAELVLETKTGETAAFPIKGSYEGISYTEVSIVEKEPKS